MIPASDIIARQLAVTQPTEISYDDGCTVKLVPARYVPPLSDDASRLSLNGTWRVARWPFKRDEQTLALPRINDSRWESIEQPGKVFYNDPEENPATIKDWDRVKLTHISFDDGAILRRTVRIPSSWRDRRIYLRFDAVYPACRVYLDGSLLGEHLSGL